MPPSPCLPDNLADVRQRRRSSRRRALCAWVTATATVAAIAHPAAAGLNNKLVPSTGALIGATTPNVPRFQRLIRSRIAIEHSYYRWTHIFPGDHELWTVSHGRIPLITWEPRGTTLAQISGGSYDALIRARAVAARAFGRRFFLRFGHEMNGDWYAWDGYHNGRSPAAYVAAWRHVHDIFTQVGATNVVWVWSPHWQSFPTSPWNDFRNYYPGDNYVDWVGTGGYNHGSIGSWSWISFRQLFRGIYNAYAGRKPIMIAETASVATGGSKRRWIGNARRAMKLRFPKIKAFVWFNVRASYEGHVFDWRVNSTTGSLRAFRRLADDPYFHPSR
jgi:beta-mannanase